MRFSLLTLMLLVACGDPESSGAEIGSRESAIIGGVADPGHPAVVGLQTLSVTFCTGTLIAPKTVLTAGHCANAFGSAGTYQVVFGADATGRVVPVTQQVVHPNYSGEGKPFDLALFELGAAQTVTPQAFARTAVAELDAGVNLVHVGFGATHDGDVLGDGVKRTETSPITRVDGDFVYSGDDEHNTCNGDSGGPGLVTLADGRELQISIVSDGPSCLVEGWDQRVDVASPWIASTAASWGDTLGADPFGDAPDAGGGSMEKSGGCADVPGSVAALIVLCGLVRRRPRCST